MGSYLQKDLQLCICERSAQRLPRHEPYSSGVIPAAPTATVLHAPKAAIKYRDQHGCRLNAPLGHLDPLHQSVLTPLWKQCLHTWAKKGISDGHTNFHGKSSTQPNQHPTQPAPTQRCCSRHCFGIGNQGAQSKARRSKTFLCTAGMVLGQSWARGTCARPAPKLPVPAVGPWGCPQTRPCPSLLGEENLPALL